MDPELLDPRAGLQQAQEQQQQQRADQAQPNPYMRAIQEQQQNPYAKLTQDAAATPYEDTRDLAAGRMAYAPIQGIDLNNLPEQSPGQRPTPQAPSGAPFVQTIRNGPGEEQWTHTPQADGTYKSAMTKQDPYLAQQVDDIEKARDQIQASKTLNPIQRMGALNQLAQKQQALDPNGQYGRNSPNARMTTIQKQMAENVFKDKDGTIYTFNPGKGITVTKPPPAKPDPQLAAQQKLKEKQAEALAKQAEKLKVDAATHEAKIRHEIAAEEEGHRKEVFDAIKHYQDKLSTKSEDGKLTLGDLGKAKENARAFINYDEKFDLHANPNEQRRQDYRDAVEARVKREMDAWHAIRQGPSAGGTQAAPQAAAPPALQDATAGIPRTPQGGLDLASASPEHLARLATALQTHPEKLGLDAEHAQRLLAAVQDHHQAKTRPRLPTPPPPPPSVSRYLSEVTPGESRTASYMRFK